MGWLEAVVETMKILQKMPRWMAAIVLVIGLLVAIGFLLGKVTGR